MLKFHYTLIFILVFFLSIGQEIEVAVPEFSHEPGYYEEGFELSISYPNSASDVTIIYSLDGSEPQIEHIGGTTYLYKNNYQETASDPIGEFFSQEINSYYYSEPIFIQNQTEQPNVYADISLTYTAEHQQMPSTTIPKANVVRAKAIDASGNQSETVTATYLIGDEEEFQSSFPIISLNFSAPDFFDFYEGIGVAGDDFESWRINNINHERPEWGAANYQRRGVENEILANFEYFEGNEEVFNKKLGVRVHGGASRTYPIKSLRLYARNDYGENTFHHAFFPTEELNSFRRLILRNSGQDRNQTLFRDAFIHNLFSHIENDYQAYRPINLFLNGEYWGVMNIRERYSKQHFELKYGIDEEDLDHLQNNMSVREGDAVHYHNMIQFARNNDLSVDENYAYMQTQMDMNSFIDHFVANIYSANYDWPQNNIQYWRKRVAYTPDAPYGHDGRWRWVLQDMDAGFNGIPTWIPNSNLYNSIDHVIRRENVPDWAQHLFKNLIANDEFVNNFNRRMLDLLNTSLLESHVHEVIQNFRNEYEPEINKHINRWNFMQSFSNWEFHIEKLKYFAEVRTAAVKSHMKEEFDFEEEEVGLILASSNINQGSIQLNRTLIHPETPGVNKGVIPSPGHQYIWSGAYFKNLSIQLHAVPELGYRFSHWSGASNSTDEEIEINLSDHTQLMAHFEPLAENELEEIPIHFWVMDDTMPNNTPLQELESTFSFDGLSATIEYTSCLTGYPFNENHENWRRASMERRNRPTPLNYIPEANFDFPFESVTMRGLQIRQPFEDAGQENQLIFNLNTSGFEDIKLSFAAKDEGAVEGFEIMYYNASINSWTTANISSEFTLETGEYQIYEIDFSGIDAANDQTEFLVQLTFTGDQLTADNGDRVTFNNIAVLGTPFTMSVAEPEEQQTLSVYPNPTKERFFIDGIQGGAKVEVYNLQSKLLKRINYTSAGVNVEELPNGVYFLSIQEDNKKSTIKLIKN